MKKQSKYTFLDEDYYCSDEEFDSIREDIALCNDRDVESVSADEVYEVIQENNRDDWRNFTYFLGEYLKNHKLISFGKARLWSGTVSGYLFVETVKDFVDLMQDINTITFENGELKLIARHHNGNNVFRIKELTPAGCTLRSLEWCNSYTEKSYDNNFRTRKINLYEFLGTN